MTYEIVSERTIKYSVKITNPYDIYKATLRYAKAKKEQFIIITLNDQIEILSIVIVSIGLVNRTLIHPREVFIKAIKDMATGIIICHNHPSGNLDPSFEDRETTERLAKAGEIIGIPVLDHVIISKNGYYSFKERGDI